MKAIVLAALLAATVSTSAASAKVDIVVDLPRQTLTATRGDGRTATFPVSSGRSGFETPGGEFQVERLDLDHRSRKYDDAPMPYAMFFRGGYAIHGSFSKGIGRPASHGCVRLGLKDAALLYDWVEREGGQVRIEGRAPTAGTRVAAARTVRRGIDPYLTSGRAYRPDPDDMYYVGGRPAYEGVPRMARRRAAPDPAFREYLGDGVDY